MPEEKKGKEQSFPKTARLRKSSEFHAVQQKAQRVYCKHFLLLITKGQTPSSRLGITVTRKINKRAVIRNKIKRRLRDIFRRNRHLLRENFDLIIIARKNAADLTYQGTLEEIIGGLTNKGYLKKH